MSRSRFMQLLTELSSNAELGSCADLVLSLGEQAFRSSDSAFPRPGSPTLLHPAKSPAGAVRVGDVDLSGVLTQGAKSSEEFDLLTALTLLGLAVRWPSDSGARIALTERLLWLEAHSGLRCLSEAEMVFNGATLRALGEALLDVLARTKPNCSEYAVGRAWLLSCTAKELGPIAMQFQSLSIPSTQQLEPGYALHGDLGPKPRGATATALLALSTLLFFSRASRALARLTLGYRNPASLVLNEHGLLLSSRLELLGRVIKERKQLFPLSEIRQVQREVRYPRLGLYAGLSALTLGTLLGTRLFVDGLRVTGLSFVMMAWGILFVLLGLGLDLLLAGGSDSVKGQCRLVVQTRKSGAFSLGSLDPAEVDSLLSELSTKLSAS